MPTPPAPNPITALDHAAIGAAITRAGVSLFPVYLFQPMTVPVVTGRADALQIAEADEESVPILSVTSLIDDPFLLLEGETVAGGLQQRTLTSVSWSRPASDWTSPCRASRPDVGEAPEPSPDRRAR